MPGLAIMAQSRHPKSFRGAAQRFAPLTATALHPNHADQEGIHGNSGTGRSRISALQERFNTWTYQAITRLHHQSAALRKAPPAETSEGAKPQGEDHSLLIQRVALLEDRLCRLEGHSRAVERWDPELRPGLLGANEAPAEVPGGRNQAAGHIRSTMSPSPLPRSPLEAWLTEGLSMSSGQVTSDLPVPEPLVDLLEEDVAIPSEAIDLHFLARSER